MYYLYPVSSALIWVQGVLDHVLRVQGVLDHVLRIQGVLGYVLRIGRLYPNMPLSKGCTISTLPTMFQSGYRVYLGMFSGYRVHCVLDYDLKIGRLYLIRWVVLSLLCQQCSNLGTGCT